MSVLSYLRDDVQSILDAAIKYAVTKYQANPVVANIAIAGVVGSALGYLGLKADASTILVVVGFVVPLVIGTLDARRKVTPYVPDEAPGKEGDDSKLERVK
jgi:hypothetical protein